MLKLCQLRTLPSLKNNLSSVRIESFALNNLRERSLIAIVGEEAPIYLQGLITNDIYHLSNDLSSQYAMFLNSKGRVLYDSILYRIDYKTYFIECDSSIISNFEKYLKTFRLKRKVDVVPLNNFKVYSLFKKEYCVEDSDKYESLLCKKSVSHFDISLFNKISKSKLFKDPRVLQLGYRVLLNTDDENDFQMQLQDFLNININLENVNYRKFRYSLGVGEGIIDLPIGNCFPLESNCDYLHGVSFHKGCYIGQELTARTHHTGVTRKRLMPIYFENPLKQMPEDDFIIHGKIKLGKLRGIEGDIGLGLIRTDLLSSLQDFKISGISAVIKKPVWWPVDAPKYISLKK
ncbi:hypothetical protein WA026_002334 [Henosepilachna vigintioctopunctata]|uniref:CAF17 C-terminal domain-containing protein n=1 Tax=Henosepilachna vigintioctopunctata TaxID=420089 RepID=A0AAW1TR32_9CUCU